MRPADWRERLAQGVEERYAAMLAADDQAVATPSEEAVEALSLARHRFHEFLRQPYGNRETSAQSLEASESSVQPEPHCLAKTGRDPHLAASDTPSDPCYNTGDVLEETARASDLTRQAKKHRGGSARGS